MRKLHAECVHVHLTIAFAVASARALTMWATTHLVAHVQIDLSVVHQLPACVTRPGFSHTARADRLPRQPPTLKEKAWQNTAKRKEWPAGEAAQ
jgi:hypothetical protein